jgi:hypothetical protein
LLSDWIAIFALIGLQLGFAALLGLVARLAQTKVDWALTMLGGLVYIASSLCLPLPWPLNAAVWLASAASFVLSTHLKFSPPWQARLMWLVAGSTMLLIFVWGVVQGWPSPAVTLGVAAAWAGVLAWRRGLQAPS